jgi:hypothetical protein
MFAFPCSIDVFLEPFYYFLLEIAINHLILYMEYIKDLNLIAEFKAYLVSFIA